MDPATFAAEVRRLTQQISDSVSIEHRLQQEIDQGLALAATGRGFPPGHGDAQWLLSRRKEDTQKLRNACDRMVQRRQQAVNERLLELLRRRVPKDVAACEILVRLEFDVDGAQ